MVAIAHNIDSDHIKKLTDSVNGRFVTVNEKKGGYTGHRSIFFF